MLGPFMFLLCTNDIGENISLIIHLFADDYIVYQPINSSEDTIRYCRKIIYLFYLFLICRPQLEYGAYTKTS